jgi:S-DNA-T family DNA segregation ATPase FtsK/SpoIIIE
MSRTTAAAERVSRPAEVAVRPAEPVGVELVGVALALVGLLLAGAMLTHATGDQRGGFVNVAGGFGRAVVGPLLRALGVGAWALPIAAIGWGVACVRGRPPSAWARRVGLVLVVAALVSVEAALVLDGARVPGLARTGPGGYVGVAFGSGLYRVLGKGAGLVVLVGIVGTLRYVCDVPVRAWLGRAIASLDGPRARKRRREEDAEDGDDAEDEGDEGPEGEAEAWEGAEAEPGEDEGEAAEGEDDEAFEGEIDYATAAEPSARARARVRPKKPKKTKARREAPRREGPYVFPPTSLLEHGISHDTSAVREEVEGNAKVLGATLASFGIEARVVSSQRGPVITFYEIAIASGIRLSRITALADDLAIALKAPSVRIVAPIPGRSTVGVEVPNLTRDTVVLRDLLEETEELASKKQLPIFLGRDTAGRPLVEDLTTMPHILVAGATGSGKSVCINTSLLSFLFVRTPAELRLILIDPKQVELTFFEGIPHLLSPVVTDMRRAAQILEWAVEKMEERYGLFVAAGVRNIAGYNALTPQRIAAIREQAELDEDAAPDHLPYLVIVVDELADLMMTNGKDVELAITRLAQKSRAVGIHLILATQRPSTNVITGLIKANMPTRIAFHVSSKIDSRVILDANGADKLLGMGDMLLMHPKSLHLRRAQGTLVTDPESRAVIDFVRENGPEPEYKDILGENKKGLGDPMKEDDLYNDSVRAVLATRLGSASMLQRRLSIGYTRASRLIDLMCDHGVVGPHVGSKAREVMYTLEEWEAKLAAGPAEAEGRVEDPEAPDHCPDESWD